MQTDPPTPSTRLRVHARDGNAMLPRLTSVLGPFTIDRFEYVVGAGSAAHVVISVIGGARQAERVAAKLTRLVGVHDVVVDPAD